MTFSRVGITDHCDLYVDKTLNTKITKKHVDADVKIYTIVVLTGANQEFLIANSLYLYITYLAISG